VLVFRRCRPNLRQHRADDRTSHQRLAENLLEISDAAHHRRESLLPLEAMSTVVTLIYSVQSAFREMLERESGPTIFFGVAAGTLICVKLHLRDERTDGRTDRRQESNTMLFNSKIRTLH